jgi:hypothetical protein
MTLEQFEKAQEIRNEIEFVLDVESLLVNWRIEHNTSNILTVIYGSSHPNAGQICNSVGKCYKELQNRLIQTCRDYYHELNKQFDEM